MTQVAARIVLSQSGVSPPAGYTDGSRGDLLFPSASTQPIVATNRDDTGVIGHTWTLNPLSTPQRVLASSDFTPTGAGGATFTMHPPANGWGNHLLTLTVYGAPLPNGGVNKSTDAVIVGIATSGGLGVNIHVPHPLEGEPGSRNTLDPSVGRYGSDSEVGVAIALIDETAGFSGDAISLRGRAIAATTPTNGQVYEYDSSSSSWKPVTPSSGGLVEPTSHAGLPLVSHGTPGDPTYTQVLAAAINSASAAANTAAIADGSGGVSFGTPDANAIKWSGATITLTTTDGFVPIYSSGASRWLSGLVPVASMSSAGAAARKVPLSDGSGAVAWGFPRATDLDGTGATTNRALVWTGTAFATTVLPPAGLDFTAGSNGQVLGKVSGSPGFITPFTLPGSAFTDATLIWNGSALVFARQPLDGLDVSTAVDGMAIVMNGDPDWEYVRLLGGAITDKVNVRASRITHWLDGASQSKAALISDRGNGTTPGSGTGTVDLATFTQANITSGSSPTFVVRCTAKYGAVHASGSDTANRVVEAVFKCAAGTWSTVSASAEVGTGVTDGIGSAFSGKWVLTGSGSSTAIVFQGVDTASGSSTAITHNAVVEIFVSWP